MAKQIVIVGGGAGGLELATQLGNKYKNNASVDVLLLDKYPFHIWKPLYHEVATGSLDVDMDGVDFRAHAANNHFEFQLGELKGLDRESQTVQLEAIFSKTGEEIVPEREIHYDYLVLAIGSITNDFGTPGVKEHCLTLDTTSQAEKFHQKILNEFLKIKVSDGNDPLKIAIVGAGATGVELSAELYKVTDLLKVYGFKNVNRHSIQVTIIEASDRILGALPERISDSASKILTQLGVELKTKTMVKQVMADGVLINDDQKLDANITVWCAGVKGADVLKNIGGLNTNKINQIVVNPYMQSDEDEHIFALGDCASFKQKDGSFVPPRAQSAHQMAKTVSQNIQNLIAEKPLVEFVYKDKGSLVSFADYTSVGFLSSVTNKKVFVEGSIARHLYISLYRLHQAALHGYLKMLLLMLVGRINRRLRPLLKLH
ncbi:NAD(P)/FAD-dependent oxidoreductase [Catenovulum sp. 2E275]|uniref:NAD(P)/FAD-dependent oxidoreductase n=1 Tax=Catenovulum sp. 2E275 TaxID=2980497 RepID=UPI0021D31F09|nr:NAD(P)/FAD-dependent oxidoreductase [Catenovulum sp. 2E275]MCU4675447.1 NAD(P)/FAD-dependent oxidoreductase [Catenovulum sp. 2E275]